MKARSNAIIGLLLWGSVAVAEPIYLQPGQCILIGSQQVCAMQPSGTMANQESQTIYSCQYGMHKDAEVSDLKSYALFQMIIRPDGRKIETSIKNYGMNGKSECEKEAESRSKK